MWLLINNLYFEIASNTLENQIGNISQKALINTKGVSFSTEVKYCIIDFCSEQKNSDCDIDSIDNSSFDKSKYLTLKMIIFQLKHPFQILKNLVAQYLTLSSHSLLLLISYFSIMNLLKSTVVNCRQFEIHFHQ